MRVVQFVAEQKSSVSQRSFRASSVTSSVVRELLDSPTHLYFVAYWSHAFIRGYKAAADGTLCLKMFLPEVEEKIYIKRALKSNMKLKYNKIICGFSQTKQCISL
jgi:hypothetical protein